MMELTKKYAFYNYWANKKLINKLTAIPAELLSIEIKSSFPSIIKTILHIYDAETIWYKRLQGISLTKWPAEGFIGTASEALNMLKNSSLDLKEYTENITNERLLEDCTFQSLDGKSYNMKGYDIIQHCINHSTFHRGQIITMLRGLDINDLPSTDYIAYLRDNEK